MPVGTGREESEDSRGTTPEGRVATEVETEGISDIQQIQWKLVWVFLVFIKQSIF